jgi:transposase
MNVENLTDFSTHPQLFYGLDLAKKQSQLAVVASDGAELANFAFPSTRENFRRLARMMRPEDKIVLEVSTPANAVMSIFAKESTGEAVLSNPLFTKSISKATVKSDKEDARKLANLKRAEFLETVWHPDADTLRLRHFVTDRESLVGVRTMLKNQVHSVLQRNLIEYAFSDIFGIEGAAWLKALLESDSLDAYERDRVRFLLAEIARQTALVEDLDATIAAFIRSRAALSHQLDLMMSVPGVSLCVGAVVLSAVGDATRFPTKQRFASYFGLTHRLKQTGGKAPRTGPISKQGNAYARFMLIEAAEHFKNSPPVYRKLYERIKKKKGHNKAIVAVARRLAELIWCLLTRNEEFIYAPPRLTDEKRAKVSKLAREKAGLRIARRATNQIVKGTNLRGREIKEEIRRRAADEATRILDLMNHGKRLSEASPSGFNPRKPNFTNWNKLLEIVARDYVRELNPATETADGQS